MQEVKYNSYDKIQVYNRTTNSWSKRFAPEIGYQELFVLDKTTDRAKNIKIRYNGEEAPKWKPMDWVRILHLSDPSESASYTADGLPDNFNEYVIAGVQSVYNKRENWWNVSLDLMEPIERFNGIIGETLSYTNQTNIEVYDPEAGTTVSYTQAAYNHLTALERWLKLTPANCDNYASGYDPKSNISWFNRIAISAEDKAFLQGIPFADTTFNGLSLYEVLMDTYDTSTGRTPVAYFDLDPATDLPRNPERDEYILRFERQDGYDKPEIDIADLKRNASGMTVTQDGANYATGLVADVQNLAASAAVTYPCEGLWATPEVDTSKRDLTDFTTPGDNWIIKLPHAIKKIKKLMKLRFFLMSAAGEIPVAETIREHTDITKYCYDYKAYLALIEDPNVNADITYYREGSNQLHLRGYVTGSPIDALFYYIEYEPYIDCRLMVGDTEYTQNINQATSQVDTQKFSQFMKGYLDGMDKADVIIERTFTGYNNIKDLLGSRVIDGDKEYRVTAIQYVNRQWLYDCIIQLNENHFRKSNNYEAAKEIKANAIIDTDNLALRQSTIKQEIWLSATAPVSDKSHYTFISDPKIMLTGLIKSVEDDNLLVSTRHYPQFALVETTSKLKRSNNTEQTITHRRAANIAPFIFGKSICFNITFEDNMLAGSKKEARGLQYQGSLTYYCGRVVKQIPVVYADYYSQVDTINMYFYSIDRQDEPINKQELGGPREVFDKSRAYYKSLLQLPKLDQAIIDETHSDCKFKIIGQNVAKDALEKFNNTVAIEYKSNDLIIGADVLKHSRLMLPTSLFGLLFFRNIVFLNRKITEYDKILEADIIKKQLIEGESIELDESAKTITYTFNALSVSESGEIESVCIDSSFVGLASSNLLILNKINDTIKNNAKQGKFILYYGG